MPYLSWKSFDWQGSGLELFKALKDRQNIFFLDSALHRYGLGRYSFLGFEPFYVFREKTNPGSLERLRNILNRYKLSASGFNVPFIGGAVGYCSYDLGLGLENIESANPGEPVLPDVFFAFYDAVLAIDHLKKKMHIFSSGLPERPGYLAKKRAKERINQILASLRGVSRGSWLTTKQSLTVEIASLAKLARNDELIPDFSKEGYLAAVRKAKEYIRKGEIYQVNLSQRFCSCVKVAASDLYLGLRRQAPADFCAYLDCGDFQILSSSPERFLRVEDGLVSTRPMKGTRPRGKTPKDDLRQKKDLIDSPKDRAELLMITDLLRNDLGRVCEYGSIRVRALREIESYSTVYQTTSSVEGRLHKNKDRIDLLKACFPGGSITGCPKIRSMRIIDELESCRRGVYTGALGYLGFNGTMDLNILIRTILKKGDKIYFQAGGGIVADSDPEAEYEETLVKARGIFKAVGTRFPNPHWNFSNAGL